VLRPLLRNEFRRRSSLILILLCLSQLLVSFLRFRNLLPNSSHYKARSPDLVAVALRSHCTRSSISVNLFLVLLLGLQSICSGSVLVLVLFSVLSGTSILFCVLQYFSGYTTIIIVQSSAPVDVFCVITTSGDCHIPEI